MCQKHLNLLNTIEIFKKYLPGYLYNSPLKLQSRRTSFTYYFGKNYNFSGTKVLNEVDMIAIIQLYKSMQNPS